MDARILGRIDLSEQYLIILNINDRSSEGNLATALPDTEQGRLYYIPARVPQIRHIVNEMHASALDEIYPAADGAALAYFQDEEGGASLYVLSLEQGFRLRVLSLAERAPRGIRVMPSWSPDGRQLAIAIANEYEMDIYALELEKYEWRPLTRGGGYDFHPAWSPDGRHLAYLSDREQCPSWQPASANTCNTVDANPPRRGQLYLLDLNSGEDRRISEIWLDEPPRWLDEHRLAYPSGADLLADEAQGNLWITDIRDGATRNLFADAGSDAPIPLDTFWSANGDAVVFQDANPGNRILLMNADGRQLGIQADYQFPRYGLAVAWRPDGQRLAMGGVNGQCPYGVLVFNRELIPLTGETSLPMCEPRFSPDGAFLAFEGITIGLDGRLDVYRASALGYGAINLTEALRGTNRLIGWAGGR